MNDRDTHFAGFAKVLLQELMDKYDHLPPGEWGPAEKDELIIARRAYDLVNHAIASLWPYINDDAVDPSAADIPDFEWPEQSS